MSFLSVVGLPLSTIGLQVGPQGTGDSRRTGVNRMHEVCRAEELFAFTASCAHHLPGKVRVSRGHTARLLIHIIAQDTVSKRQFLSMHGGHVSKAMCWRPLPVFRVSGTGPRIPCVTSTMSIYTAAYGTLSVMATEKKKTVKRPSAGQLSLKA